MLKFEENPAMCPVSVASIADLEGDWWVAHTKPRCEKALAHDLSDAGVGYYLPMVERLKVSGSRKRRVMLPLFTSYVFFCGNSEARYAALKTGRLCQVIPVTNRAKFVDELVALERALACDAFLDLYPFAVVGRRCRVRVGPMLGIVGTVIERDHRSRLVLQVSMLGQGASLEIDTDLLEPVD